MRTVTRRWIPALALGLALGWLLFGWNTPARAGDNDERFDDLERGWVVEQSGRRDVYKFDDRWRGAINQAGFTMTNDRNRVSVLYYGTFRVIEVNR